MPDTVTLREHLAALREADLRVEAERDRRLTEVAIERANALQIKDEADRAALELARDAQHYRDEQANKLRDQLTSERGDYATRNDLIAAVDKIETAIRPLIAYTAASQGRGAGIGTAWAVAVVLAGLGISVVSLILVLK